MKNRGRGNRTLPESPAMNPEKPVGPPPRQVARPDLPGLLALPSPRNSGGGKTGPFIFSGERGLPGKPVFPGRDQLVPWWPAHPGPPPPSPPPPGARARERGKKVNGGRGPPGDEKPQSSQEREWGWGAPRIELEGKVWTPTEKSPFGKKEKGGTGVPPQSRPRHRPFSDFAWGLGSPQFPIICEGSVCFDPSNSPRFSGG